MTAELPLGAVLEAMLVKKTTLVLGWEKKVMRWVMIGKGQHAIVKKKSHVKLVFRSH